MTATQFVAHSGASAKTDTTRPKVVAMVPAYDAAEFITATLHALSEQTYPNLEILISDDASTDATAEICERLALGDERFRVVRQPQNLGWIGNVNFLLSAAVGDYVLMAFHDDLIAPTYVERCVDALEANRNAAIAFSNMTLVWADGHRDDIHYFNMDGVTDPVARATSIALHQGDWWVPLRGVLRASAVARVGGLRKHLRGEFSADWPWLLHLSTLGEFVRVPENLLTKFYRDKSLSQSWDHYEIRAWTALTLSTLATVWRTPLPKRSKFALQLPVTKMFRERVPGRLRNIARLFRQRVVRISGRK